MYRPYEIKFLNYAVYSAGITPVDALENAIDSGNVFVPFGEEIEIVVTNQNTNISMKFTILKN